MRKDEIVTLKVKDLVPYARNNKKHGEKQIRLLKAAIQESGYDVYIVVDEDNVILKGHARHEAITQLGWEEVKCIKRYGLSKTDKKYIRIADNKLADLGEYDIEMLQLEVQELQEMQFDVELLGFDLEIERNTDTPQEEKQDPRDFMNLDKFYPKTTGKYGMPLIRKQNIDVENIDLIGFNYARSSKDTAKFLHFFLDDYQFYRVWNELKGNGELVKEYAGALSPDFSLYLDYPISLQIYNTYRNRYCGAYWQSLGVNVIPTIGWSNEESFDFCFDGVEKGSIVAVGTVGILNNKDAKELFIKGYNEMLKRIEPSKIIIYGNEIEGLEGNKIYIKPFSSKWNREE